jgi:16S rRNA (cytosine967-C5)-methyltransferase
MAAVSAAREAAFAILLKVERGHAHSDELLRGCEVSRLSAVDRNLTTALVMGVLRWQIVLDARVRPLLKRPGAKLDTEVLIALRLGAFQMLHMDRIPAHAAIDESVELVRRAGHRFASGMVNAVLRRLAADIPCAPADDRDAYPAWMVERWTRSFGEERTRSICHHGQSQPAMSIRIDEANVELELAESGIQLAPGSLLKAARSVVAGDVTDTPAFREGSVRVQDEGSQLVAEIAGQGSAILDCCAAPGGKALILAERNPKARIVACEVSPARWKVLRDRLSSVGERVECLLADATGLACEKEFDLVLADVPCSGTGTLGRNPEIRCRLREDEFARQAEKQKAILASALRAARTGGRVVYSTCSLEPEENEQVVATVLAATPGARQITLETCIETLLRESILIPSAAGRLKASLTPEGALRLLPGTFQTDGFFVALIERIA